MLFRLPSIEAWPVVFFHDPSQEKLVYIGETVTHPKSPSNTGNFSQLIILSKSFHVAIHYKRWLNNQKVISVTSFFHSSTVPPDFVTPLDHCSFVNVSCFTLCILQLLTNR